MVRIKDRLFVLAVDQSKIQTYRGAGAAPVQTILYNVKDTKPIDLSDIQTIHDFCVRNNIRKIHETEAMLICAYAQYQQQHKDVDVISFGTIIELLLDIEGLPENSAERAARSTQYNEAVRRMGTDNLVGPLQPISSYLGNKLVDDPESINGLVVGASRMDYEWKKIANPAKTPFKHWALVLCIIGGLGAVGAAGYYFLGDPTVSQEDVFDKLKDLDESGAIAPDDLVEKDTIIDQLANEAAGGNSFFDDLAGTVGDFVDGDTVVTPASDTDSITRAMEGLERIQ